jgi:FMN phosphatase YigB (HAD superfamily)
MDPSTLRNKWLWGDVCKVLGKPELKEEIIRRYRILKEKYGSYGAIREGHIDEVLSYVLGGDKEALKLYQEKTPEYVSPAEGLEEALEYLKDEGILLYVVCELKKTLGPVGTDIVSAFLKKYDLIKYFDVLVSPKGKINLKNGEIDLSYEGFDKISGTLYDKLVAELRGLGIQPSECVMIGDKPETDIEPARQRGFHTVQYIGYVNLGPSNAEYVISNFSEIKNIVKGVK